VPSYGDDPMDGRDSETSCQMCWKKSAVPWRSISHRPRLPQLDIKLTGNAIGPFGTDHWRMSADTVAVAVAAGSRPPV